MTCKSIFVSDNPTLVSFCFFDKLIADKHLVTWLIDWEAFTVYIDNMIQIGY